MGTGSEDGRKGGREEGRKGGSSHFSELSGLSRAKSVWLSVTGGQMDSSIEKHLFSNFKYFESAT